MAGHLYSGRIGSGERLMTGLEPSNIAADIKRAPLAL
jgi:hypothetical protein